MHMYCDKKALFKLLKNNEKNHSWRVAKYARNFGYILGLNEDENNLLHELGLFHDIGKAKIRSSILNKKSKLDSNEIELIKNHSIYSEEYLMNIPGLKKYKNIVRAHHERWDGQGYPDCLKTEEIPLFSRIISIVDVYDALTSERPYRELIFTKDEALKIINNGSGTQFDPELSKVFIENHYYILKIQGELGGKKKVIKSDRYNRYAISK